MQPPAENAARSAELRRRPGRLCRRKQHEHADDACRQHRDSHSHRRHGDEHRHDDRVHAAGNGDDDIHRAAGIDRWNIADRHERPSGVELHAADDLARARRASAGPGDSRDSAADEQQHERSAGVDLSDNHINRYGRSAADEYRHQRNFFAAEERQIERAATAADANRHRAAADDNEHSIKSSAGPSSSASPRVLGCQLSVVSPDT